MKRSEVNKILTRSLNLIESFNFKLPPFIFFSPTDWKSKGREYQEIKDNMLGWDLSDHGSGDFNNTGLVILTLRGGNAKMRNIYQKPYTEKLLVAFDGQSTPKHLHFEKIEDIINRGGGNFILKLWNADNEKNILSTPVSISLDGRSVKVEAGEEVCLKPGESITLGPMIYHSFEVEKGSGDTILGEVCSVIDDDVDLLFYDKQDNPLTIDEDEEPLYLLVSDY